MTKNISKIPLVVLAIGVVFLLLTIERQTALGRASDIMMDDYQKMEESYASGDQASFEKYQSYVVTDSENVSDATTARNIYGFLAIILIVSGAGTFLRATKK